MPITTAEEKAQKRLEKVAGSCVEKRFGRNATTRKTQKNLLKQQYENFTAPSSEMLDQTFDRLQKLVSQLELLDEKISQEDVNQKLLRSLSQETRKAQEGVCCGKNLSPLLCPDSEVSNDSICLKSCLETAELLKSQNDQLLKDLKKSELMVLAYKTGDEEENLVPRAVLMKSGLVSVNTARQVNVAHSKTTVNAARPMSYLSKTTHSTVKRLIHKNTTFKNSNNNQRGNPQMDLQNQGAIDSRCLRHMTWNMSYLTDYEEMDGGYVAFGGNPKGGKITGKLFH
ncbi:hypothetical protein Tco_1136574 [Tanacetum coccineum]